MGTILTGVGTGTAERATVAMLNRRFYIATGWTKMQTWDGVDVEPSTALPNAGMTGPSQEEGAWAPSPSSGGGTVTEGTHAVRYRYQNSKTGFVSNPSNEYTLVAAGSLDYTFAIDTSGSGNIIRSADAKVDKIVVEMTQVGGEVFFVAKEVLQTASSVTVSLSDVALEDQILPWPEGRTDHTPPPIKRYVVAHRGRLWAFGEVIYDTGTINVTEGGTSVTGTSTAWTEDALGTTSVPPRAGRRFLHKPGYSSIHEITNRVSATSLTIADAWPAESESGIGYEILSKDTQFYFSEPAYPEAWPLDNELEVPAGQLGGQITAGIGHGPAMLFFTADSAFRLLWTDSPKDDGAIYPIPGVRGALSQRVVVAVESNVYSFDRQGPWCYANGVVKDLSHALWKRLRIGVASPLIGWSTAEAWHAVHYPECKAIRWFLTTSGSLQYYVQLDLRTEQWSEGYCDQTITESALIRNDILSSSPLGPCLGDSLGHTWFADRGTMDGATDGETDSLSLGTRSVLVEAGASTTTIPVDDALPTDAGTWGMKGVAATWLKGDGTSQTRLIVSNTSSSFTVSVAYSGTPAEGDTIYFGRVRGKLKTKAFKAKRDRKVANSKFRFRYTPVSDSSDGDPRYVQVRVYHDLSTTARTDWADADEYGDSSDNVIQPGRNPDYPATDFLVDVTNSSGLAEVPLGLTSAYYVEVELEVSDPDVPLEIYEMELEGMEGAPP